MISVVDAATETTNVVMTYSASSTWLTGRFSLGLGHFVGYSFENVVNDFMEEISIMPPVRINVRDIDAIEDLDELETLVELVDHARRGKSRQRADRQKDNPKDSSEIRARKLEQRRKGKELARLIREREQR